MLGVREHLLIYLHNCLLCVMLNAKENSMSYTRNFMVGISVCACAGGLVGVASADEPLGVLEPSHGRVVQAAHIYYNISTGERVVTLMGDGDTAPANVGDSVPIWSSMVLNQCAAEGYTTEWFFGFDNNAGTTSLSTAITVLDNGDIALDTVVDCVHVNWVTGHSDVDADSDGVGDGIPGLAGEWTWWDADNGRAAQGCMRLPLISFRLIDLPGNIFGEGEMTSYSIDVDLASSFSSSLTFEIGDSDGDLQGAAFGNNNIDVDSDGTPDGVSVANADRNFDGLPDSDLDGDGLFDWAWTVRFYQPGTADLDGDGVIDGDFADSFQTIGINFGAPDGTLINDGGSPPTWSWDIDLSNSDPGTGQEDRFAIFAPPDTNGDVLYAFGSWFGGLECSSAPLPDGPGYTPAAMFEHRLFGPTGTHIDCGDFNQDGVLNFFDVSLFIQLFQNQDPLADMNNDGQWDFFDVSQFVQEFSAGCP
jgi:hypothetical protein